MGERLLVVGRTALIITVYGVFAIVAMCLVFDWMGDSARTAKSYAVGGLLGFAAMGGVLVAATLHYIIFGSGLFVP